MVESVKKKGGRPRKYATEEEALAAKQEQMRVRAHQQVTKIEEDDGIQFQIMPLPPTTSKVSMHKRQEAPQPPIAVEDSSIDNNNAYDPFLSQFEDDDDKNNGPIPSQIVARDNDNTMCRPIPSQIDQDLYRSLDKEEDKAKGKDNKSLDRDVDVDVDGNDTNNNKEEDDITQLVSRLEKQALEESAHEEPLLMAIVAGVAESTSRLRVYLPIYIFLSCHYIPSRLYSKNLFKLTNKP